MSTFAKRCTDRAIWSANLPTIKDVLYGEEFSPYHQDVGDSKFCVICGDAVNPSRCATVRTLGKDILTPADATSQLMTDIIDDGWCLVDRKCVDRHGLRNYIR